jgi:hypothetical protein
MYGAARNASRNGGSVLGRVLCRCAAVFVALQVVATPYEVRMWRNGEFNTVAYGAAYVNFGDIYSVMENNGWKWVQWSFSSSCSDPDSDCPLHHGGSGAPYHYEYRSSVSQSYLCNAAWRDTDYGRQWLVPNTPQSGYTDNLIVIGLSYRLKMCRLCSGLSADAINRSISYVMETRVMDTDYLPLWYWGDNALLDPQLHYDEFGNVDGYTYTGFDNSKAPAGAVTSGDNQNGDWYIPENGSEPYWQWRPGMTPVLTAEEQTAQNALTQSALNSVRSSVDSLKPHLEEANVLSGIRNDNLDLIRDKIDLTRLAVIDAKQEITYVTDAVISEGNTICGAITGTGDLLAGYITDLMASADNHYASLYAAQQGTTAAVDGVKSAVQASWSGTQVSSALSYLNGIQGHVSSANTKLQNIYTYTVAINTSLNTVKTSLADANTTASENGVKLDGIKAAIENQTGPDMSGVESRLDVLNGHAESVVSALGAGDFESDSGWVDPESGSGEEVISFYNGIFDDVALQQDEYSDGMASRAWDAIENAWEGMLSAWRGLGRTQPTVGFDFEIPHLGRWVWTFSPGSACWEFITFLRSVEVMALCAWCLWACSKLVGSAVGGN